METTILLKENRTQLVLHPTSEFDKEAIKILKKLPNAHECNLFDTQGGFTRGYMSGEDLMIVFDTSKDTPLN